MSRRTRRQVDAHDVRFLKARATGKPIPSPAKRKAKRDQQKRSRRINRT